MLFPLQNYALFERKSEPLGSSKEREHNCCCRNSTGKPEKCGPTIQRPIRCKRSRHFFEIEAIEVKRINDHLSCGRSAEKTARRGKRKKPVRTGNEGRVGEGRRDAERTEEGNKNNNNFQGALFAFQAKNAWKEAPHFVQEPTTKKAKYFSEL